MDGKQRCDDKTIVELVLVRRGTAEIEDILPQLNRKKEADLSIV